MLSAQAEDNLELLLPQIAWHDNRGAIQSVDASSTTGLLATAGNDNEVRLWRLSQQGAVSFVQALTGHTKVRWPNYRPPCHPSHPPCPARSLSTSCASAPMA